MIDTDKDGTIDEDEMAISVHKILDLEHFEKKKKLDRIEESDFEELKEYRDFIVDEIMQDEEVLTLE